MALSQPASAQPATDPVEAPEADAEAEAAEPPAPEAPEAPELEPGADEETGIRGRVVAGDTDEGLADAPVLIEGQGRVRPVITDADGAYELHVPPGRYIVRSYFDMYHGARLSGVQVRRGRMVDVSLTLDPIEAEDIAVEAMEVVYRADTASALAQQNMRRETVGAVDTVSSQEISRSGDSSASAAARRVVGVTVDSNNLLVVRGLGGRYATVLLNGVAVPSTDPDRPGVQLDVFPTSLLDNLAIHKAFRPDLPGSWAGGVMAIGTRSYPEELTLKIGVSLGVNTMSTFRDRLDYDGGGLDFLGFDDGTRGMPAGVPGDSLTRSGPYDTSQRNEYGRLFSGTWQYDRRMAFPNMGLGLTLGNSHSWGEDRRVGYLISFDYGADFSRTRSTVRPDPVIVPEGVTGCAVQIGNVCQQSVYQQEAGQLEVIWGTLANVSLQLGPNHEITALSFFNRNTSDTTFLRTGKNFASNIDVEGWQLQFVGRTLLFDQLLGDHRNLFGTRLRLRWNLSHAISRRDEPDTRSVEYSRSGTQDFRWNGQELSGFRWYGDFRQQDLGGGASLRMPLWQEAWATVGTQLTFGSREFISRSFKPSTIAGVPPSTYSRPAEELFCPDCQDTGIGHTTNFDERSRDTDSYEATQNLYAFYAQVETKLGGPVRLLTGARVEIYEQEVTARAPWASSEPTVDPVHRVDVDVLPAAQLVYEINSEMYLRGGYGQTVARPQARELAPLQYYDFVRRRLILGDPELRRTRIHNVDLRWEWFYGTKRQTTELLAVSVFYKRFIDPIELRILNPTNLTAIYANAAGAQNVGVELEGQVNLGRISNALRLFTLKGNLAVLYSRVRIAEDMAGSVTNPERRLFGQSPYVANLSLRFDEPDSGFAASLVYNVIGPRITSAGTIIGTSGIPDEEQQAFHSLDLIASWQANDLLKLKLKAQNLLFDAREYHIGGLVSELTHIGATFTVGIDIAY